MSLTCCILYYIEAEIADQYKKPRLIQVEDSCEHFNVPKLIILQLDTIYHPLNQNKIQMACPLQLQQFIPERIFTHTLNYQSAVRKAQGVIFLIDSKIVKLLLPQYIAFCMLCRSDQMLQACSPYLGGGVELVVKLQRIGARKVK